MKFYDCQTAPSPRRVRIFIAEKGIELETVQVDLGSGEQFGEPFRKLNPDCVVPVVELDDGTCISEVLAICQYLEEVHPEPALFGRTAATRAAAMMWTVKVEQQGLWPMADAFRNAAKGLKGHALPGPIGYEQIPELARRGRERVAAFFNRLDEQLDSNDFVAGDAYSIADITALVFVDFAAWIKIDIPDDASNVRRWYTAVASRKSAKA